MSSPAVPKCFQLTLVIPALFTLIYPHLPLLTPCYLSFIYALRTQLSFTVYATALASVKLKLCPLVCRRDRLHSSVNSRAKSLGTIAFTGLNLSPFCFVLTPRFARTLSPFPLLRSRCIGLLRSESPVQECHFAYVPWANRLA